MFDNKRKFSFKVDGMFVEFDREKDEYSVGILIANSTDGENVLYKANGKNKKWT